MENCIFCHIISGRSPAKIFYRDEKIIAFQDIHPVAPFHILIVPLKHIPSINQLEKEDMSIAGQLLITAQHIAREQGFNHEGYRIIINTGAHGGQVVNHLHIHLIGGRKMRFPMG